MKLEIEFLDVNDLIELHCLVIREFGGSNGVRDLNLLESAAAQPQVTFNGQDLHPTLFDKAVAYAFHIAQNQPFFDGNKRTGLMAALVFLSLNAVEINDKTHILERMMLDIAEGTLDKAEFSRMLKRLAPRYKKNRRIK